MSQQSPEDSIAGKLVSGSQPRARVPARRTGIVKNGSVTPSGSGDSPDEGYPSDLVPLPAKIDATVKEAIADYCRNRGITAATLLEALCVDFIAQPKESILAEAQRRSKLRKEAGVKRRAEAMLSKLSES